jgi:hypothetical protein
MPVASIEMKRPRLEDVFVQLVDDGNRSAGAERKLRAELAGRDGVAA